MPFTFPSYTIVRPDGSQRIIEARAYPIKNDQGQTIRVAGIARDITEKEAYVHSLFESENRYRTLFENMTQGVFYQDSEGNFLDANKACLEILGLDRETFLKEASAKWPWKMLNEHGQELPREERPSLKALSTGKPVTNSVVAVFNPKKNDHVWLNINAIPLFREGEEKPYQVFVTLHDIINCRQEEEKIAFLSNVFVNLDVNPAQNIAMIVNETGRLLQGAACLYNRLDDEKKSLCVWASLNAPPDLAREDQPHGHICYEATIKGQNRPVVLGELLGSEYEKSDANVTKYGLRSYLGYPVRLAGEAIGALCIVDVTPREFSETEIHIISTLAKAISLEEERQRAEEALEKAKEELEQRVLERTRELQLTSRQLLHVEKLSAVGQLSASIAHEFNNPLQGILNIVSGVKRRAALSENDSQLMDMAVTECERMKELIKGLQDFNRPSSSKLVQSDIGRIIDAVLLLTRKEFETKNIRVEKKYAPDLPEIPVIADQLKQVLLNLLTNAADACGRQGGLITIRTEKIDKKIAIHVADTGKGIKPEDMEHIFEPFFSTKPEVKGVGLGLSVSYGIVKRHGGDILVENTEGKGATFTITLPVKGNHDEK